MKTPTYILQIILDRDLLKEGNELICNCVYYVKDIRQFEIDRFREWFKLDIIPDEFYSDYWDGSSSFWDVSKAKKDGKLKELLELKRECMRWLIAEYKDSF